MRRRLALVLLVVLPSCIGGASDECFPQAETTSSGLVVEDLRCGTGDDAIGGVTVLVHYEGRLQDGTVFESTRARGDPLRFVVDSGTVIEGFDDAVRGMAERGVRRIEVPPELGYGDSGLPPSIPPNATLIFEIELLEVELEE
ncbi:MAG: FKBP-type peptidyl-prolyl cis-trans isomerase [Actinomycetota bacterium]